MAGVVDHVGNVLVARRECKVHETLVAAARLIHHLCAQVLVILGAIALARLLQLRLGARAERRNELVVVAPESHEAAIHRLVHSLAVVDRNELFEP